MSYVNSYEFILWQCHKSGAFCSASFFGIIPKAGDRKSPLGSERFSKPRPKWFGKLQITKDDLAVWESLGDAFFPILVIWLIISSHENPNLSTYWDYHMDYVYIYIYSIYTWNPKMTLVLIEKRSSFGGFKPQNRGSLWSPWGPEPDMEVPSVPPYTEASFTDIWWKMVDAPWSINPGWGSWVIIDGLGV